MGVTASATGILGGAFDPPHNGHRAIARGAIARFALERLLVRVVADPGHKEVRTPAETRLALARLAFADMPLAEIELDPFPRTVDSLEALALEDPVFLVGADEFASFLEWKEPDRVLALARLGVATRPGVALEALEVVLARLRHPEKVVFFGIDPVDVSSSSLRERIDEGGSLAGLVPASVEAEIERQGLYGAD
jgi:nicotinate-nucleotide adenylyltransferase